MANILLLSIRGISTTPLFQAFLYMASRITCVLSQSLALHYTITILNTLLSNSVPLFLALR